MRTGTGIFLIAAGAVLRFAVAAGSPHGLNVHVVGVVLMLAGVLGLLLSLLVSLLARGGPPNPRRLIHSIRPGGYDGSRLGERKRAAAADVAAVLENDRFRSLDTPGRQETIVEPGSGR